MHVVLRARSHTAFILCSERHRDDTAARKRIAPATEGYNQPGSIHRAMRGGGQTDVRARESVAIVGAKSL